MIIKTSEKYFNIKDTLECGQIFRFIPYGKGYIVFSLDKICYAYNENGYAFIECEDENQKYFHNFFDLDRDYSAVFSNAISQKEEILSVSANLGKGIRILNQDKTEALFSFIVSQNNNIPRIKGIIERLCIELGEKREFLGKEYYSFPKIDKMAKADENFYKGIGLGYRSSYIKKLADLINEGFNLENFNTLKTLQLKQELLKIYGVGPKVADCVSLFGFHRADAFPVDTWIEKVYRENFGGELKDRKKISEWFVNRFGENSGYIQQYLFYYKRSLENK